MPLPIQSQKIYLFKKKYKCRKIFFQKKSHFSWNLSCKIRLYRSGGLYVWFLASKITFFQLWIFSDLGDFLPKTKKIGCLSLSLLTILLVKNFTFRDIFIYISFITHLLRGWTLQTSKIRFGSWFMSYRIRHQNWVKKAKNSILCNFLHMISTNWPYYYNPIFWRQMFFIVVNIHQKWEELR